MDHYHGCWSMSVHATNSGAFICNMKIGLLDAFLTGVIHDHIKMIPVSTEHGSQDHHLQTSSIPILTEVPWLPMKCDGIAPLYFSKVLKRHIVTQDTHSPQYLLEVCTESYGDWAFEEVASRLCKLLSRVRVRRLSGFRKALKIH